MATTIALKDHTYDVLRMVKEELQTETFDDTINSLIINLKKSSKSLFGKYKSMKPFVRDQIDRFA